MADMRYRRLGRSGLSVSVVGIGCNNFGRAVDEARTRAVVDAAIDCGITLFDTGDIYGDPVGSSEAFLGAALKANGRRDDVVIATKFGHDMGGANGPDWGARGGRRYIMRAVEASLRRLGTDHIDLYQLHLPDPQTPIEETLSALDDLVRAGTVRYVGSSNFAGWQVTEAAWVARSTNLTPFVSAQNHYSWLHRGAEAELVPALAHPGVGLGTLLHHATRRHNAKYRRGAAPPAGTRRAGERWGGRVARPAWGPNEGGGG
jgi:aryl-alcohol dehydrogenase-like predicted oxidoreductase